MGSSKFTKVRSKGFHVGKQSETAREQDQQIQLAAEMLAEAAALRTDAKNCSDYVAAELLYDAEHKEKAAEKMLEVKNKRGVLSGGEIALFDSKGNNQGCDYLVEIGNKPMVNIRASSERLDLIKDAGVLTLGADAAASIENPNPFEKMLSHQMAATHKIAMQMFSLASKSFNTSDQIDAVQASFFLGQATKLMKTFQSGMQTLMKSKKGGRQEMVVQHIHVEKDAKAVVAGKMDYPAHNRGAEISEEDSYEE